uniref:ribonuclease H n=1 Tax=Anolis carolinensis TaxID=28377 RepID=A0A803SNA3_ANOCA
MQEEISKVDPPETLERLINHCLRAEVLLANKKQWLGGQSGRAGMRPPASTSIQPRPVWKSPPPAPNPMGSEEEPMQLGNVRPRLDVAEKARRQRLNLCWYCGNGGHLARECPAKRKRRPPWSRSRPRRLGPSRRGKPATGRREARQPGQKPHSRAAVVTLWSAKKGPVMIHAMIDSGATNNFIDREYADSLGLQYHDFKNARVVQAIDGRPLKTGPVSQWTEPTRMWIREHMEEISFFVTEVPHFPVILGIPWLTLHDPNISWTNRELQFASKHCQNHCLVAKVCHATDAEPIITLPKKYSDFWDVFNEKEAEKLPPHRPYDCAIDLVEGAPIPRGHLYSLTEPEQEALREFIESNLRKGFIRPSQSPAASPVMFVKKKSGDLRLVVDYRALNNITKRNRYPLPLITDLLDRLRGAKVYTKLDLRGAYNLVRIREGDEWKTAFQTKFGLFESLVMNYGLSGAPATFQHFVNDIFQDYLDRFLIIYLDDFLVFSRSQSEHENHVRMVLQRLRDHGLYAKLEKCAFDLQEVDFLGYRVSPQGLSMDPAKFSAVLEWRAPTNKKEVQCFLGFANYYRKFIPDFARWSDPITSCIRGKQPFRWTEQAEKGFQQLKKLFTIQPILQHPDPKTPFVV